MTTDLVDTKIDSDFIIEAISKNKYLLDSNETENISFMPFGYNNRVIISNNQLFLQAMQNDLGGEIIHDNTIGSFLHLD
jgi:hypothetical protein